MFFISSTTHYYDSLVAVLRDDPDSCCARDYTDSVLFNLYICYRSCIGESLNVLTIIASLANTPYFLIELPENQLRIWKVYNTISFLYNFLYSFLYNTISFLWKWFVNDILDPLCAMLF